MSPDPRPGIPDAEGARPAQALVLGATGSFGGAMAREFLRRGVRVRALVRDAARARVALGDASGIELVVGDVQDLGGTAHAAADCDMIVHGVNYPYEQWRPQMVTATENVIAAASHSVGRGGPALVIFPGNVYGLGRQTSQPLDETAENAPSSKKGALRVELEEKLKSAARAGAIRVLIVRAGDYFGPTVRGGFGQMIFGNAVRGKPLMIIGRLDAPHQWAFLPDLARATAELVARRRSLGAEEIVHFPGHVAESQRAFLRAAAEEAGHPGLSIRRLPWWLVRVSGLANPTLRELWELRYLFDESVILTSSRLPAVLPGFEPTPLRRAVGETLARWRE